MNGNDLFTELVSVGDIEVWAKAKKEELSKELRSYVLTDYFERFQERISGKQEILNELLAFLGVK